MKTNTALVLARRLKGELLKRKLPVEQMFVYGSIVRDAAHKDSDIDIAVVCRPFLGRRLDENVEVSKARWGIDLRIETFVLHPDDFSDENCVIAQEVKKEGILV